MTDSGTTPSSGSSSSEASPSPLSTQSRPSTATSLGAYGLAGWIAHYVVVVPLEGKYTGWGRLVALLVLAGVIKASDLLQAGRLLPWSRNGGGK